VGQGFYTKKTRPGATHRRPRVWIGKHSYTFGPVRDLFIQNVCKLKANSIDISDGLVRVRTIMLHTYSDCASVSLRSPAKASLIVRTSAQSTPSPTPMDSVRLKLVIPESLVEGFLANDLGPGPRGLPDLPGLKVKRNPLFARYVAYVANCSGSIASVSMWLI
jgi:hypothetical protein